MGRRSDHQPIADLEAQQIAISAVTQSPMAICQSNPGDL
jgi:hypothetical protein